jgi:hypothetical protein
VSDVLTAKRRLLAEQPELSRRAADALKYSWDKTDPERIGEPEPEREETLEALTARFAPLDDILVNGVFPAVVTLELANAERLPDVLDLMERLRLIQSTEQWIELKELRNAIVHEYEMDDLPALQRRVYWAVPVLLQTLEAAYR